MAGSLDGLKVQVNQSSNGATLGRHPAVASRLKTQPIWLTYLEAKSMLEDWMGKARIYGPVATAMLAQQGINMDLPPLPDFQTIAPHVLPQTSTVRLAKQMIVFETYESVPLVGSVMSAAPALGAAFGKLAPKAPPPGLGAPTATNQ